ncbi:uncharacterized protein LOC117114210 [Anneissia japonica]|uniref:uncharacterized protein LOC117114210 n=1 Tax=Anneissia japonica TaxID=1529436 RepID=UPI0014255B80|nr:uncharacterized protein LOC117114210 [Anneissia japonica]
MAAHMFIVKYPNARNDEKPDDNRFFAKEEVSEILRTVLPFLGIQKQVMTISENEQWAQITFICSTVELTEKALNTLSERGIGKHFQTSLSVIPVPIHLADNSVTGSQEDLNPQTEDIQKDTKVKNFVKSIRSRLIVAQVVEQVKSSSNLTFDFVLLIILASLISAIGLSEDSSVVLVASMLISPLMGPIMGGTFGIVIKHSPLRNIGIKTEVVGLLMCVFCGLLFGFVAYPFLGDVWPTDEMKSRGKPRSLLIGLFIALPSGAGVALSILGNNTGSLIGVAISASLLPPAVNAGMLWATSIISACQSMVYINTTDIPDADVYSSSELAVAGTLSLILTLLNILCVFLMAVLVMKIKEVAPKTSTATTHQFWKNDIKVAREYYDVIGGKAQGQNIGKKLFQDFQKTLKKLDHGEGSGTDTLKGREAAYVARDFKALLSALEKETHYQDIVQQLNEPQLNVSNQIPTSPSEPEWLGNLGWKSNTSTTTSQRSPYREIYRLVSQDDYVFPGTSEPQSRRDSLHGSYSKITAEAPKEDPV